MQQYVATHTPTGVVATLIPDGGLAYPWSIASDHPVNHIAKDVLTEICGVAPNETRVGVSVPVLTVFQRVLGAPIGTHSLGILNCNIHSPDEFTDLATRHRGCHALALMFQRYRDLPRST